MRAHAAFAVLFALSCGSSEQTAGSPSAAPSASASSSSLGSAGPSASASASATAVADMAFPWRGGELGQDFYKGPIVLKTQDGQCSFTFSEPTRAVHVECMKLEGNSPRRLWGWDETRGFVEDAALAVSGDFLFVARLCNISSGARVQAYRLSSGELMWVHDLVGLGPISHSEYLNDVELFVTRDKELRVSGWEAAGRYVETLRMADGQTTALLRLGTSGTPTRIDPPRDTPTEPPHPGLAATVNWAWNGPEPHKKSVEDVTVTNKAGTSCAFTVDSNEKRSTRLVCRDRDQHALFGFELAAQFVPGGAMAIDEQRLYWADYSAIASGAGIVALDLTSGRPLWRRELYGIGPVSHSKYRNELEIHLAGEDRIAIFGWESSGKYVEVLRASTGEDLGSRLE
ncbi:MAG: hypothetical protein U0271_21885 [Polyangiaceae bacterium]